MNLEWYVLNYDCNTKKFKYFNIFNSGVVQENVKILCKQNLSFDEFTDKLDNIFKYAFWAKREYEISIADAFETDVNNLKKIDCYYQLKPNLKRIAEYIIKGGDNNS